MQPSTSQSFNPRPREGATRVFFLLAYRALVSIHAPVKGRLRGKAWPEHARQVSIHAPVKGRHPVFVVLGKSEIVSIHAPVKGRP